MAGEEGLEPIIYIGFGDRSSTLNYSPILLLLVQTIFSGFPTFNPNDQTNAGVTPHAVRLMAARVRLELTHRMNGERISNPWQYLLCLPHHMAAVVGLEPTGEPVGSCGSQSPVPYQLGDTAIFGAGNGNRIRTSCLEGRCANRWTLHPHFFVTEPKDFHLWEQWLGSCLQPLPAVFPLFATNISNPFLHCYFKFPCF